VKKPSVLPKEGTSNKSEDKSQCGEKKGMRLPAVPKLVTNGS
jgi:hypothetical protein